MMNLPSRASALLVAIAALQPQATTTAIATATATATATARLPRREQQRVAEGQEDSALLYRPLQQEDHIRLLVPPQRHRRQWSLNEMHRSIEEITATNETSASLSSWYPDWAGGTNACLRDQLLHPAPHYMSQQKLLKDSVETCCDKYFWWDLAFCLEESAESDGSDEGGGGGGGATENVTVNEGTREWYAEHADFRCVQDCPLGTSDLRCGGLLVSPGAAAAALSGNSSAVADPPLRHLEAAATSATAAECCQSNFVYLALGLCVTSSKSEDEYEGSGEYYVDYNNGRCVQDCPANSPPTSETVTGICGGIITDSSTQLYEDASTCCSARLSYLDPLLCQTRSEPGGVDEGTFRLYPSFNTGTCIIDHRPDAIICSIGYTCQLLRTTAWVSKLYPVSPGGVEACCAEGLAFVNPSYCKARTMGVFSNHWFADYAEKRCFKDCEAGSGSSCAVNHDPTVTYYDTPELCCSKKLGYLNNQKCLADSTGVSYEGTGNFYVDYKNSKCVRDCPVEENSDMNTNCGGLVENSNTRLHEDSFWCCAKDLGYMSLDLCADRSNGTSMGTGLYYPSGDGDSFCVKDTSAMPCPPGETCRRVDGWVRAVYDSIAECCQSEDPALLATTSPAYCEARSTGAGTEKWFKNEGHAWCSKHCSNATNTTDSACKSPSTPPSFYYATSQECCTVQLGYLNSVTCAELSEKGGVLSDLVGTEEYYVDWIKLSCVKNCPAGNGAGCGGIAGGKWVDLHPDPESCCKVLHYVDQDACIAASTSL